MATATFIGTDTVTAGSWRGVYGADGYAFPRLTNVPADRLPSYLSSYAAYAGGVGAAPASVFDWTNNSTTVASPSTDARAVQDPVTADRWAVTWFDIDEFRIYFNVGATGTRLAIYFLDYDNVGRIDTASIYDGATLLDTRSVSSFGGGKWLVWDITGSVMIDFLKAGPQNAVAEMLAFGPLGGNAKAIFLPAFAPGWGAA